MPYIAITLRVVTISSLLVVSLSSFVGPRYPPTSGEVWPKPFLEIKEAIVYDVNPEKLQFKVIGKDCELVQKAINRFKDDLKILSDLVKKYGHNNEEEVEIEKVASSLNEVQIMLETPCEEYPHSRMNESYDLIVSAENATLNSNSVWGTIRGLETLSQLFYVTEDFKAVKINATVITDMPNFPYRGYLLDTSRHYSSVGNILKTLDAMAMNKLNVFHWHIYDDNSFPYVSAKFPELSKAGAFHSSMVYNRTSLEKIREYARERGIRVIIEFDMPGHSESFGVSHPEILSMCNESLYSKPMNPVKNETYRLIKDLLSEVQDIFPDNHFHLGGDEVEDDCWRQDPTIKEYMKNHNITQINEIRKLFYNNMIPLLKDGTFPIFWEEVRDYGMPIPENSYIQVWRNADTLIDVLREGYYGIQSAYYYLDRLRATFRNYYIDPRAKAMKKLKNETLLKNIVGGTACMWGEMIDDTNELSRSWPHASAMAEALWSYTGGYMTADVYNRIEEHVCRMRRRGVPAQPASGPGFCVT